MANGGMTPEQRAALEATLVRFQTALDNLLLGLTPTEIRDQNGELAKYAVGDPNMMRLALQRRIIELQHKLGLPTGFCGPAHIKVIG